jgi:hypothetical protein
MKKLRKKISRLAKDATDDEIIRWTKSNDLFDRLEAGVSDIIEDHADVDAVLHEAIFQDNTAQLNMRHPPAMKAVLSKLARERTTDATTLARIWLAERLERELKPDSSSKETQERPTIRKLFASEMEVNDRFIVLPRRPKKF